MNMTFNFSNTTQYGGNFGVTAVQQDGYTTGQLTGINIDRKPAWCRRSSPTATR